jgi:hypothetical protein
MVLGVWALDAAHSALICQSMYFYLVSNYDNPKSLINGTNTLWISIVANLTTSAVVQFFFARRIFILSGTKVRWPLSIFIAALVILHVVFGLMTIVGIFEKKAFSRIDELTAVAAPFAIFAVLADFAIAISLCILLHKRRTGFKGTGSLISTLIIYAINRCLLTSAAATAEIIVLAAMPTSFWFLAIDFVVGKLYANSLLATLNTRRSLRTVSYGTADTVPMSGLRWKSHPQTSTGLGEGSTTIQSSNAASSGGPRTQTVMQPLAVTVTKERVWDSPYLFEGEDDSVDESYDQKPHPSEA